MLNKKLIQLEQEKEQFENDRRMMEETVGIDQQSLEEIKKLRDKVKEEFDMLLKEKSLQKKEIKKLEDENYGIDEEIVDAKNNLKKLENEVRGY